MARSSSPAGLSVIPATPPRLSLLHDSDSDLDELTNERIPATSPFVTQPTQIVSNPRTTLKRPSPPPAVSDISLSSSPPREINKPSTFSKQSTFPRRNQTITSFFKRPLQLSPKMGASESARRSSSAPKPVIPQKRESDIILVSDDDDEDELAGDRADIQPTYFSRTPKPEAPDTQPSQRPTAKVINFDDFRYDSSVTSPKRPVTKPPSKTKSNKTQRNAPRSKKRTVVIDDDDHGDEDEDESEPEVVQPRRRRKLIQGLPTRNSSPPQSPPSSSNASLGVGSQVSTKATTPDDSAKPITVPSDSEEEEEFDESEDHLNLDEDTQVLKLMNDLDLNDLAALTGASEADLNILVKSRPFKSLGAVLRVHKMKEGRGKQKKQKVEIGETIVETTRKFIRCIDGVDKVVAESEKRAAFLKKQIGSWDIDATGRKREVRADSNTRSKCNGTSASSFVHAPPSSMSNDLPMHDFQIFGVNWMSLLFRNGYGGILADDMGLGKTCQVIGLMARMLDDYDNGLIKEYPFPNLIIVPPSTLDNWLSEFEKFAPDLNVLKYSGSRAMRDELGEELADDPHAYHCIVTSYTQFSNKADLINMNRLGLNATVFDEGQTLKNPLTLQYQRLQQLRSRWRLLLSGTPIQNHLMEMISLLNFVDPGLFEDRMEAIQYVFDHKIHTRNFSNTALLYGERVNRARSILEPFILQRQKDQVGQNLPPKTHSIVYCDLPEAQRVWYDKYEDMFRSESSSKGLKGSKGLRGSTGKRGNDTNNVWMQLKKAALHPQLFRRYFTDDTVHEMAKILFKSVPHKELDLAQPKFELLLEDLKGRSDFQLHLYCQDFPGLLKKFDVPKGSWGESGKIKKLLELLAEYKANGDRVLIFSKFSKVIEIIAYVLHDEGIDYSMLTGSSAVGDRQHEIDRFQSNEDIPAFLLTTGAGGTGINLTAANKVIIFDMSSNPQDDRQAENRAHRLGQTREVEIVHLISRGTVEELIYKTCQKKIELAEKVTNASSDESEGKLREIVKEMLEEGETLEDGGRESEGL